MLSPQLLLANRTSKLALIVFIFLPLCLINSPLISARCVFGNDPGALIIITPRPLPPSLHAFQVVVRLFCAFHSQAVTIRFALRLRLRRRIAYCKSDTQAVP